jgi:flagellar assembly factor FliW
VNIKTSRFGELEVNENDILTFTDGLLGFEKLKKYFIVDPGDSTLILWLQSIEDANTAFPIIEPHIFKPDYIAKLVASDYAALQIESASEAKIYCVLTIPADITKMNANLKAPIFINSANKLSKQIVLQDNKLSVNYEMYMDLKRAIVNYSSDDSKRTNVELNTQADQTEASRSIKTQTTIVEKSKQLDA